MADGLKDNGTGTAVDPKIIYDQIVRTSNQFLHNCKGFSVEILRLEQPTYAEVAEIMRRLARLVVVLSDDFDPMLGQKAYEYCDLMHRMGIAIENGDQVALERWVKELERKPGI